MRKKLKSHTSVSGLNVLSLFFFLFLPDCAGFSRWLRTAHNCSVFTPLCRDYTQINEQAKPHLCSAPSPLPSLHLLCMHMHWSALYSPVCVWVSVSDGGNEKLIKLWFTGLQRSRLVQFSLHYYLFSSWEVAAILLQPVREIRDIERSTEPLWRFQQQFKDTVENEPSLMCSALILTAFTDFSMES